MTARAYLDWNASAPLRVEAREAMCSALELCGNPSSVHGEGRAARQLIEQARGEVAALVGGEARNVIFTSGGTEANALTLSPAIEVGADKALRDRLLISAIEHPSGRAGDLRSTSLKKFRSMRTAFSILVRLNEVSRKAVARSSP